MTPHSFPTYGAYLLGRLTERGLSAADLAAGITYRDRAGVRHPTTEAVLNWIRKSTMPRRELVTATALFFGDDPAEVHAFFRGVREPPAPATRRDSTIVNL